MYQNDKNVRTAAETIPVFARRLGSWQLSLGRLAFAPAELTRLYDQAAPQWARTLQGLRLTDAYRGLLRDALRGDALQAIGPRPRVLDGGIGTGAMSAALADVLPVPFSLDAIDISPRMLEQAKRRLSGSNIDMTLQQGDVRRLPYPDGVFDLVMTAHVLEHLATPDTALMEMNRVLKPGGVLIVFITRRSLPGMMIHLKWRIHRVTPDQALGWLLHSGLQNVRCLSPGNSRSFRLLSVACIGRKARCELHTKPTLGDRK